MTERAVQALRVRTRSQTNWRHERTFMQRAPRAFIVLQHFSVMSPHSCKRINSRGYYEAWLVARHYSIGWSWEASEPLQRPLPSGIGKRSRVLLVSMARLRRAPFIFVRAGHVRNILQYKLAQCLATMKCPIWRHCTSGLYHHGALLLLLVACPAYAPAAGRSPLLTYQAVLTASSNLRQSAMHYQGFFMCTRSQCSPCGSLAAVLTVTGPLKEGCIL